MLRVIILTLSATLFFGCSTAEKKTVTPGDMFKRALEFEEDDRFEEAIRRYQEIRSKFPYSSEAVDAELAIADVYFKQESFPESQAAYLTFKDLHPRHPKVAYVFYRYALSVYMQLPDTIDRDLSISPEAVLALNDVIKKFPNSEFVKEAQEKRTELVKKMAEKEIYVADFYFKKKLYTSSLGRFETAAKEYLGLGYDEKILARATLSAVRSGNPIKARDYASKLESLGKLGSEAQMALEEARK